MKTREPEDEHCVLRCTYIYIYICDTLPLDNPKIHLHTALPYITWGLIQDLKIKKEIPIEIKILSVIPKKKKQEGGIISI